MLAILLPCILITFNYEFYLIPNLIAPDTFRPFTSLKEMIVDNHFTIWYIGVPSGKLPYFGELVHDFSIKGILHHDKMTFVEANTTNQDILLTYLSSSNPKMAAMHAPLSLKVTLAGIKAFNNKGKYSCYAYPNAVVYKHYFDFAEVSLCKEMMKLVRVYTESGLRQVWDGWNMFRYYYYFYNQQHDFMADDAPPLYISFKNLIPLLITYGVLISGAALQLMYEVHILARREETITNVDEILYMQ